MQESLPSLRSVKPSRLWPHRIGDATRIARSSVALRAAPGLNLLGVWRNGWEAWLASAAPILAITVIGLAGPFIVIASLATVLGLDDYVHLSNPLTTYQGLALLTLPNSHAFKWLLAQAVLAAIFSVGAHLGIVWLMLRRRLLIRPSHIWRALPMIVFGVLGRGILLAVPAVAINSPLSGTPFDLNNLGQKAYSQQGLTQVVLLRTFSDLIPAPGSPFTEFLPVWRQTLRWPSQTDVYDQHLFDEYGAGVSGVSPRHQDRREDSMPLRIAFVFTCGAAAIVLESLLRLHIVGTLHAVVIGEAAFAGFLRAVALGLRHFGWVVAHTWGLRLAGSMLMLLFITIPQVVYEGAAVAGFVQHMLAWFNLTTCGPVAFAAAWAVMMGVLTTFGLSCDVQLYRALTTQTIAWSPQSATYSQ